MTTTAMRPTPEAAAGRCRPRPAANGGWLGRQRGGRHRWARRQRRDGLGRERWHECRRRHGREGRQRYRRWERARRRRRSGFRQRCRRVRPRSLQLLRHQSRGHAAPRRQPGRLRRRPDLWRGGRPERCRQDLRGPGRVVDAGFRGQTVAGVSQRGARPRRWAGQRDRSRRRGSLVRPARARGGAEQGGLAARAPRGRRSRHRRGSTERERHAEHAARSDRGSGRQPSRVDGFERGRRALRCNGDVRGLDEHGSHVGTAADRVLVVDRLARPLDLGSGRGRLRRGCGVGRQRRIDPDNPIVGSGGGYGAIYCFALEP